MSVYVGIDVHRKRSQVAVIDANGEVVANRNVPNGVEPILGVIGGLPAGTPVRRSWRSCCAPTCCRRHGSPRRRCASCGRCCGTGWR